MRRIPVMILVSVAALLAAPAGAAAAPVGEWWAGADLWFAQPTNINSDVAFDFKGGVFSGGDIIANNFDTELSGRLVGGWRDRDATHNSYTMSYWSWDNSNSLSERGGVQPIVTDPYFANVFADRVNSDVNIKTSVLDMMLTRRLTATQKSVWYWGAGLRHAEFKHDWEIQYFDASTPVPGAEETVNIHSKVDGTGLTAALGTVFSWSPRWQSSFKAQAAMLKGKTDATYRDHGFDNFTTFSFQTTEINRNEDRNFVQLELQADVSFQVLNGFEVHLGYWFLNWGGAVQEDRFRDDVQGGPVFTRDDLGFDGFFVGGTYTFQ